jgi:hypothetical protein
MNFYWFGRPNNISKISLELEESGFKGVLLPYASDIGDYTVQVARAMNVNQKLKYIIAIRPYTISPQHLATTIKSLNSIDSDRIWINFVVGQILDEEKNIGGIIGKPNDLSSQDERRNYLLDYIPIFFKTCKNLEIKTTICISGIGEEATRLVEEYGDYSFLAHTAYDTPYAKSGGLIKISKPRVLSMFPLIEDDPEVFNEIKSSDKLNPDIMLTTTQDLIDLIKNIKSDGVNDLMFYCYWSEDYRVKIINFVKQNKHLFI